MLSESALKVDYGRKILCYTEELDLHQQHTRPDVEAAELHSLPGDHQNDNVPNNVDNESKFLQYHADDHPTSWHFTVTTNLQCKIMTGLQRFCF